MMRWREPGPRRSSVIEWNFVEHGLPVDAVAGEARRIDDLGDVAPCRRGPWRGSRRGSRPATWRSGWRRRRFRAWPSRRAPSGRASARCRTGRARTRRRAAATAARKLKLWSAASRDCGSTRPGSCFCRTSDGLSAIATVIFLSRSTSPLICRCRSRPGGDDGLAGRKARIGLHVAAHDVAVGRQRRGERLHPVRCRETPT